MIGKHNSDIELTFYNDRVKEIIDAGIIAEPFTYVPIKAGHMELIGGNAIVFGKITEGFDVIEPLVEVELTYEAASVIPSTILKVDYFLLSTTFKTVIIPGNMYIVREVESIVYIYLPLIVREGDIYFITIVNPGAGLNITGTYTVAPLDTVVEVKAGLEADLLAKGCMGIQVDPIAFRMSLYPKIIPYRTNPFEAGDEKTNYKDFTVFTANILSTGFSTKFPILKCGATHGFGVVYKDRAGRVCSVVKNAAMTLYIPFYSEDEDNDINSLAKVKFKISHRPPVDKNGVCWAESYEIVYFGNISMDFFLQVRADGITDIGNGRYAININDTITWTWEENNRWKVSQYTREDGDRLRLIGTVNAGTGVVTKYDTPGATYDYEIEESNDTDTGTNYGATVGGDWLICQAIKQPVPFAGETDILVEVYRPRKGFGTDLAIAYGCGMVFDILTDSSGNKYHDGDVAQCFDDDGLCTVPAEVDNTANDSWKFLRLNYVHNIGTVWPFWAESIFPSDWWSGQDMSKKLTSNGFPFLDDLSQRQTELDERIRHGGFLITGTRTNNIAHFTYLNYRDLAKKNGDIIGLRETGYTLNVVQMYKETSIYINRVQTFNPDGTSQFTLTDTFLGDMRPLETDYGCQHPDSIMVNGRNLYYWDNSQGVVIRSAPNGQQVLDMKMKRWFKDLVKWIQLSGGSKLLEVHIGANNDHDEVWMTFRMGTEVKGLIFNEKRGRYVSELNQITESYIHLGNFFAHLYHQRLWIMNIDEGQDWLSWVGIPTHAELEVVSNIESLKNKIYNAVAVLADHLLQSLSKYVHIPKEASGSNELMESNIPIFDCREGVYFGEIMKDENSKGNFVSLFDKKMNGRAMRGRYCFVKLMTDEHDEKVRVDSVVIFSTPSERNV